MGNEKRRILIVEDEKNIAMLLSFNLGRAGFETDVAEDGELGLRKALSDKFDIVLLDIMLPKLDGFRVLEGIRTRSDVPVLMVTARRRRAGAFQKGIRAAALPHAEPRRAVLARGPA